MDLQAVNASLDMRRKSLQETLAGMRNDLHKELGLILQIEAQTMETEVRMSRERVESKIVATRREFQAQLKLVKAGAECGRGTGTSLAKPPKFDGTTSWAMVRCQLKTLAEHNCWTHLEKSAYLISALHGQSTSMLHRVLKGATYEETPEALEDRFRDQHLAATYRNQLKRRTQGVGESFQEFATAIEQLCPPHLPSTTQGPHKEGGRQGVRIEDFTIKIQLLLEGEKMVNEAHW
jgi:hypothetical protein